MPEHAVDYRRPIEHDEGAGLLFRNGAFVAPVRYTLVAVKSQAYTGIVQFEPNTVATSVLGDFEHSFSLETIEGRRLTCRPIQALDEIALRWIVRLT